jgi:protein-L-isoaspartate(D-aspartate) O-methyltransferase
VNGGGKGQGEVDPHVVARRTMIDEQLVPRGIKDPRVLEAMAAVPRHRFVSPQFEGVAYDDRPLPLGMGQTISQPFMVARATELAEPAPGDNALEIGAGCGYQAAVLGWLCRQVHGVEIVPVLAERAAATLAMLGFANVTIGSFDGSGGWPEHAPYDVIVVSAGAPRVPALLLHQLADGGRLVVPVGSGEDQVLTRVRRTGHEFETILDTRCRYVDLVGRYGVGREPPRA